MPDSTFDPKNPQPPKPAVVKPQVPAAERNVAEELEAEGRKATDPDKQRAFGGPDFAKIPEDLPRHEAKLKEQAKAKEEERKAKKK